jgi:hypothetical protein
MIKKLMMLLLATGMSMSLYAQNVLTLSENEPSMFDGLECGFSIRNEQTVDIGKENFQRYAVTVYMTNKSGCPKIVLMNDAIRNTSPGQTDPGVFAIFDCLNATGRRLTARTGFVRGSQFFVPNRITERGSDGKTITRTENIQAGFILRNGETITNDFIVIVPEGERPRIQSRVVIFSNL